MTDTPLPELGRAQRFIGDLNAFLNAYDPPITTLRSPLPALVAPIWGWWHTVARISAIVIDPPPGSRAIVLPPLMRVVQEHTTAMVALYDLGEPGGQALFRMYEGRRALLAEEATKDGIALGALGTIDPSQFDGEGVGEAEQVLGNAELRAQMYPEKPGTGKALSYSAYRMLSAYVHPTLVTARQHLETRGDGTVLLLQEPRQEVLDGDLEQSAQHAALCCALATQVWARIAPKGFDEVVNRWASTLGTWPPVPAARALKPSQAASGSSLTRPATSLLALLDDPNLRSCLVDVAAGGEPEDPGRIRSELDSLVTRLARLPELAGILQPAEESPADGDTPS